MSGHKFLLRLVAAIPYKIHAMLTERGIQLTTPGAGGSAVPLIKEAIANGGPFRARAFECAGARNDIEHRTLALDARVRLEPMRGDGLSRLAIRPYPREHEERIRLASGREVVLRPIRPEDAPGYIAFISRLNPQDVRLRFFGMVRELPLSQLARLTQIDYDREMAFIAMAPAADGGEEALGVVRTATDPDNQKAEFAIVVRSDVKRQGLGRALMSKMIGYSRSRGTGVMVGDILRGNAGMQALAQAFGFRVVRTDEDVVQVELPLGTRQVDYAR